METAIKVFKRRLEEDWLPTFCNDPARRYSTAGFKPESIKISEFDAENFLRALDSGLVMDSGGGRYHCERSSALEQIFWEGAKSLEPRSVTLWIEPVITIGTIGRLGLDYGWSKKLLGMQPKNWAFDFAVFKTHESENEYIAGEVKKTRKELDMLIQHLDEFGRLGVTECTEGSGKRVNSLKKWIGLLRSKAPFFWAVGPDNYTHLLSVQHGTDNTAVFNHVTLDHLYAPQSQ